MNNQNTISNKFDLFWTTSFSYNCIRFVGKAKAYPRVEDLKYTSLRVVQYRYGKVREASKGKLLHLGTLWDQCCRAFYSHNLRMFSIS